MWQGIANLKDGLLDQGLHIRNIARDKAEHRSIKETNGLKQALQRKILSILQWAKTVESPVDISQNFLSMS